MLYHGWTSVTCSGKSTFAKKQGIPILSCDDIRIEMHGRKYKFIKEKEDAVWNEFYYRVRNQTGDFLVDNCNTKIVYVNKIKENLPHEYEIEYKFFSVPSWKLYLRNYWRWIRTGKYIPREVMKNFINNYKKLKNNWPRAK